ncbi:hypothetical protein M9H77_30362 [Catharanthus roseus]|uniref:Uncharacterized protein n=1 Tax=Catharanthus roseus TaxID=4058 RepID=A0ACB9ZY24_CATRO|nr:hypothetical protein M9H77_30362 [Catharanthus roseus]
MDHRYGQWYPYEQEARYYGKETYESQEGMKSFLYEERFANNIANVQKNMSFPLSRQKEARKACAQKKVRFEEQLKEVGIMSNENIGKKTSIGEPSGPWSKKSEKEESARSQEIHERSERVQERVENKEERKLGVLKNKRKSLEKELLNLQEETTMRFYLNPSLLYYEFSFKELNLLLESHSFHGKDGIFLEFLVQSCSARRVSWFNCSLCDDLHDKSRGPTQTLPYDAPPPNPPTVKTNLEDLMVKFASPTDAKINSIEVAQRNQEASIHTLENQIIRQLVKLVLERTPGTLPSNTEVNLTEHVNAISVIFDKDFPKKEKVMVVQEKSCEKNAIEEPNKKLVVEAYKPKIPYPEALVHD